LVPEVATYGRHAEAWHQALDAQAEVWSHLRGVARPATGARRWWRKRIVVPLLETHITSMPGGCHALIPDPDIVDIFGDKAKFARYAEEIGASHLVPRPVALESPTFPAVLKRTNLNSGIGVALLTSQQQLDEALVLAPWAGAPVLLQEAIASRREYVSHVVCVGGRIVWHCTYCYPLSHRGQIRRAVEGLAIRRRQARPADIQAFELLLKPFGYTGPANIDYKRRPDGTLAIFEINPRLGGSLMRPENVRDLAGCLRAIVRHATWRPARSDQAST
jgi:carbamoylphosphate synthase large subunit